MENPILLRQQLDKAQRINAKLQEEIAWKEQDNSRMGDTILGLATINNILGSMSEGACISNTQGQLVWLNKGFEKLTGYTKGEVLGKTCKFLQGKDTNPATVETIRQAMKQDEQVRVELLNYRKNGETFWNDLSITPVHVHDGDLNHRYYVGIQSDISFKWAKN